MPKPPAKPSFASLRDAAEEWYLRGDPTWEALTAVMAAYVRAAFLHALPADRVLEDAELRQLLMGGEAASRQLSRLATPRYVVDLYEPASDHARPTTLRAAPEPPYPSAPLQVLYASNTPPPERLARVLDDMVLDLGRAAAEEAARCEGALATPPELAATLAAGVVTLVLRCRVYYG